MSELFKTKPPAQKRTIRYEILLSPNEAEDIRAFAKHRNLSVADFMRRAALGKRTDMQFETEIVLALREVVQSIRQLHATCTARDIHIFKTELCQLIDGALAAMLRISK